MENKINKVELKSDEESQGIIKQVEDRFESIPSEENRGMFNGIAARKLN